MVHVHAYRRESWYILALTTPLCKVCRLPPGMVEGRICIGQSCKEREGGRGEERGEGGGRGRRGEGRGEGGGRGRRGRREEGERKERGQVYVQLMKDKGVVRGGGSSTFLFLHNTWCTNKL